MTYSLKIKNVNVVNADGVMEGLDVLVEQDKVVAIRTSASPEAMVEIDGTNQYLLPGFIDMHIHGSAGYDTMDATPEALHGMAKSLVKEGVTSFLATTMTQQIQGIENALVNIASFQSDESEAELIGVHLEGPFISVNRVGAQPKAFIIAPEMELFKKWQKLSNDKIKEITIAPEVEGGFAFIKELAKQEVVMSVGHSDATYEELEKAVALGMTQGTHLYNQMRPFHHRDLGVVGGTLLMEAIKTELIADFIHSHPRAVEFAYRLKGARGIILITDAMRAKGVPYGEYELGGQRVEVTADGAHLQNGALAGSILTMDTAIRNMQQATGCSLPELVAMSSTNAAKQLKLHQKGKIAVGADADFVLVTKDLVVQKTVKAGRIVFEV